MLDIENTVKLMRHKLVMSKEERATSEEIKVFLSMPFVCVVDSGGCAH